jgi:uncharacterized membrane protein YfcA
MTPTLMFGFGMPAATAVGTDLLYAVFTKSGALLSYVFDKRVDWSTVGWMLAGSVPAVIGTTIMMGAVQGALQERIIHIAVGVALLLTALSLVLRRSTNSNVAAPSTVHPAWLGAGGALIGTLVTLSSIGAGALGNALLIRLFPQRPIREIVGTELAHAIPLATLAAAAHFWLGQVDWRVAIDLALGAVPGIWIGRRLVHRLPDKLMRYMMAVLFTGVAIKLFV